MVDIRRFKLLHDVHACACVAARCWNTEEADRVIAQIADGVYFVAELDGEIVGFTGARRSYLARNAWEIPWIAVAPDKQGQKIGAVLMGSLVHELVTRGATVILAVTQKPQFFMKMGFRVSEYVEPGWTLMTQQVNAIPL